MVDLKKTKSEIKKEKEGYSVSTESDYDKYPYWTRFTVSEEYADKIGLDKCKVGEEKTLIIKAKISSMEITETIGGGARKSVGLQLTGMELQKTSNKKDAKETFYGD